MENNWLMTPPSKSNAIRVEFSKYTNFELILREPNFALT